MRFRLHLVRPRAVAHGWGRGARILTEINRLPQPLVQTPIQNWMHFERLQSALRLERAVFVSGPRPFLFL